MTEEDWTAWYRIFSEERFDYEGASAIVFRETLEHVGEEDLYVLGGDATQTPRSSRKMEGSGWLRNLRTPPFMLGIHAAQRWFNGSWLMPAEAGYSRAVPIRWMPAFTEKSEPKAHEPRQEWEACVDFLTWVRTQMVDAGRPNQAILMVGDGRYDSLNLWKALPDGVTLLARSAKNRVLYALPPAPDEQTGRGRKRVYGDRVASPQDRWRIAKKQDWTSLDIAVRGRTRHLQYQVSEPVVRRGAPERVLLLIVVRGQKRKNKYGKTYRRQPLPFLVNAVQNEHGEGVNRMR